MVPFHSVWNKGSVMANTFELIASNTLLSSAASVTFSAIPSTYKDLVLKTSTRLTGTTGTTVTLQLNSDTTANKTYTRIYGDGTTAAAQALVPKLLSLWPIRIAPRLLPIHLPAQRFIWAIMRQLEIRWLHPFQRKRIILLLHIFIQVVIIGLLLRLYQV